MTLHEHDQWESHQSSFLERRQLRGRFEDNQRLERRLAVSRLNLQHRVECRLRDGRLGYPDSQTAQARYEHLDRMISAEIAAGATRHDRLPWLVRQIPKLVAMIDCVVLFTFAAVIFNVALDRPLQNPVAALAALLLAFLASGAAYTWLAITGDRIKTFRGELGEVLWRIVGATTWLMIAVSGILVTALALLMYSRIVDAVVSAGDAIEAGTATPLGIVFAVISAVTNLSVVAVHALDGSPQADQQRHIGRLLRRHQKVVHRHRLTVVRKAGAGHGSDQGLSA
jgi:hypothetical protein